MRRGKTITVLVIIALGLLCVAVIFWLDLSRGKRPTYGVTFSSVFSNYLGVDWRQNYIAILDELQVSVVRLPVYWNQVEPKLGEYNFSDLDWQVGEAAKRNRSVVLVVGRRVPRWPECHEPDWLTALPTDQQRERLLSFVAVVVNRYKDNPAISAWQVENEPFLSSFGLCPKPDKALLIEEVKKVRELDASRQIILTESGELSTWQRTARHADVVGSTLYRIVWNRYFGFWDYFFLPPSFYAAKAGLVQFFHGSVDRVIITELQMEPWITGKPIVQMTTAERERTFDLKRFRNNIRYVEKTGLPEVYLWGVEYWYWLKTRGEAEIWNEAKTLWQPARY